MANLLVEIGNTALKAAWAQGLTLGRTYRYQGEKLMEYIRSITVKETPDMMVVACVRILSTEDVQFLESQCRKLVLLDNQHKDVFAAFNLPDYLTADRIASLVAVRGLFKDKDCMVFDFGTTMSMDLLAADGKYQGGNITTGCRTRFKALNRYAKSLPLINTPDNPAQIGKELQASIEAGVISGIMFEIEGYIRSYPDRVVVFTGGDAIYFAKRMKNPIFVVCNLALMGLAYITEYYAEKDS